jgi:hypothetical protein
LDIAPPDFTQMFPNKYESRQPVGRAAALELVAVQIKVTSRANQVRVKALRSEPRYPSSETLGRSTWM